MARHLKIRCYILDLTAAAHPLLSPSVEVKVGVWWRKEGKIKQQQAPELLKSRDLGQTGELVEFRARAEFPAEALLPCR